MTNGMVQSGRGGWWRRVAYAAGLVVGTTIVSVVVALHYALPLAERFLTNALGSPVTIGTLSVSWLDKRISANNIVIGTPDRHLSIARLVVTAWLRPLLRGEVVLDQAVLDGVAVGLEIGADHRVRVDGLPMSETQAETAGASDHPSRRVTLRQVMASDVEVTVRHALQGTARTVRAHIDQGQADDLSVAFDGSALRLDAQIRGAADGVPLAATVVIAAAGEMERVEVRVDITKLTLPTPLVDLPPQVARLSGTLRGTLTYRSDPSRHEDALQIAAELRAAQLQGPAQTHFAADAITVEGLRADLTNSSIDLGHIAVAAPSVAIALAPEGVVLPLQAAPANGSSEDGHWTIAAGQIDISGGEAILQRGPMHYTLQIESGRWQDIAKSGAIHLAARPADGGSVTLSGALGLSSDRLGLVVDARGLQLASFSAVAADLPLKIDRGTANGKVNIEGPMTAPRLAGRLELDGVYTAPPTGTRPDEVLAAHHIEATGTIDPGERKLDIETLELQYPYAMVQRSMGGVFPYSALGVDGDAAADEGAPMTVRIKELEITGGRADFLDRTVEPQYWTALADVAADATGVALPGPDVGSFRLSARQDEINPVEATGRADEGGWRVKADLRAVFLPTLNVYLAPLLGYKATTGVLSLEIDGRVSADALHTQNRVTLRNVSMSQTGLDIIQQSTGVPLPIALALLSDPSGTIELLVPLSGDPSAGRFSLGSLVGQAMNKAVQAALTSPLRLLGLLFGTKGPPRALAVDPIPFAAGSAGLDVGAETRLEQIARILAAHTELTMVAKPEISVADVGVVGNDGLEKLAAARAAAVTEALVDGRIHPSLPQQRLVMVPWKPPADRVLGPRSGVYVELQLSADYGN